MAKKDKFKKATKGLFNRFFGFETGVDITDEVAVLHRRNSVIKNITFVSNIFYSFILFIVAYYSGKASDWLFTALFFPFTFFLNTVIKRLITSDTHDKTKQEVAMYLLATYMFISAILFYARFYQTDSLETAAYVMIYYAIVVISLYQSKKLILWSAFGMLPVMTIIHFTWTYRINTDYQGLEISEFFSQFIHDPAFSDILLRTLIFIIFIMVVYAIVSIGQYMQYERRNELVKRREVQEDFTTIVSDLFKVVLSSKSSFLDLQHVNLVSKMSNKLGLIYGLDETKMSKINTFSNIHLRYNEIENLVNPPEEATTDYDDLKEKTMLGNQIAKRLQLAQKAEDIARAHIEGAANHNFVLEMQKIQPEITSQIILLSDLYITMRSTKSYKRPYPHKTVIELFQTQFNSYFEFQLLERFLSYKTEFESMYNDF